MSYDFYILLSSVTIRPSLFICSTFGRRCI